ncbi:bifunctional transaldolase/phosoglucose isomerase [Salisaeta longa]|uniref:bifunctional transaldolase/phosoglucose isomerase n=1 Tax=Salisaeta longa TaxID=503170 RepID=UPI0003B435BC|nr:bifunctional transaldolase/phosoglucose isomerase [Salisaeta longa]
MTPTDAIRAEDQSIWLDYIRRSLMQSGDLHRLIAEDNLRGMTSNPSIFQKAIGGTGEYDADLHALVEAQPDAPAEALYEQIAIADIQRAADIMRPVFEETGTDGLVSLEVSPHLARDTEGTITEARRLWHAVNRPNLMIKVPATDAGIPAIEQLISEGINVNITLMFSLDHYEATAEAYIRGLERANDPTGIHSVASFFVSRVAVMVDDLLDEKDVDVDFNGSDVAIANAKMAYQRFQEIFHGDRFAALRAEGALVQRPLWASTSTKHPERSDVQYVEELIGPETVNTIPPDTLDAFRDHGTVRGATVTETLDDARAVLSGLADAGIDLDDVTEALQEEGIDKFVRPFDNLLDAIEEKRAQLAGGTGPARYALSADTESAVEEQLAAWDAADFGARFWRHDPTLWADVDTPELANRMGWLTLPARMNRHLADLTAFADAVRDTIDHVVVCGMGGSSLAPEVYSDVFGAAEGYPSLTVLDSTHPEHLEALADTLDLNRSLFLIASKSGTTVETLSFFRFFWDRVQALTDTPGDHFAAVTDPGSKLVALGAERNFRRVFTAMPDVGGRYSALTHFGLVPAALMGADLHGLLFRAGLKATAEGFAAPATAPHDGLKLGAVLGALWNDGRDKLTFVPSAGLAALPAWHEQLIAESTGKDDVGLVPVAGEPLAGPDAYDDDRVFIHFHLEGAEDEALHETLDALEAAGHPVLRIALRDTTDLAREMYVWEVAVAAAGAVMGIQPFNQPNVEAAKKHAKAAMTGDDPAGDAVSTVDGTDTAALTDALRMWMGTVQPGDYLSVQAYLAPNASTDDALHTLQARLRDRLQAATTLGYGPRFLHSTGQLHKGGPNTVRVLQLVDTPTADVPVPETDFTFEALIRAQALGDYHALRDQDRTVLRIHLGPDPASRLSVLIAALEDAQAQATA